MSIMEKTAFEKWNDGELCMLGGFQTTIFDAYRRAGHDNQEKLKKAFPYWFLTQSEIKQIEVNKEIAIDSSTADSKLTKLANNLVSEIKKFLDEKGNLKLEDGVNISYANEEMIEFEKVGDKYHVRTEDNNFGLSQSHDLDDRATVAVQDLIWMLEQIENYRKGQ